MFCTNCGTEVNEVGLFCSFCGSKIVINYREQPPGTNDEKELISYYFRKGYKYKTITLFLKLRHNIEISIHTLKRRMQSFGLQRTAYNITEESLRQIISREIEGSASTKGYRALWSSLKVSYGINIQRDVVMKMLGELDPNGTETRRARRFKRRQYVSVGPNFCWHADGYDKQKPYGFPIDGCVDGFSRKILWIKVSRTNSGPVVLAYLYIETVKKIGFRPQYVQTDCGSENGILAGIQCSFLMSQDAHRYGSSPSNQRIENWWSHLRKGFTTWVIEFFKDLVNDRILIPGNHIHLECRWFLVSPLLQKELDEFSYYWNSHFIRGSRHDSVSGIPDVLFYLPEASGFSNQRHDVTADEIENVLRYRDIVREGETEVHKSDTDLKEFFEYVVESEGLSHPPGSWNEAKENFVKLVRLCM